MIYYIFHAKTQSKYKNQRKLSVIAFFASLRAQLLCVTQKKQPQKEIA